MSHSELGRRLLVGLAVLSSLALPGAIRASVQQAEDAEPDSTALLESAKEEQQKFERYRESRLPPEWSGYGGTCDAIVGRMCLRHGDGEEPEPAPLPVEVELARTDLLRTLSNVGSRIPGDNWVMGQRVYYLVEQKEWFQAESLTRRCQTPDEWWCLALQGYILQSQGLSIEAEPVFEDAIDKMTAEERSRWLALDYLLDDEAKELFEEADPADQESLRRLVWLLGDPLYLVEGNDREVEQHTRQTLIRIREGAENAYELPWDADLEELVLRYGGEIGWERGRVQRRSTNLDLSDNRHIIGRHRPHSREFLPTGGFLTDPPGIPVRAWEIDDLAPRTGYAPYYAPIVTTMDAQVARFRRGDSLLVVAGYQPPQTAARPAPSVRNTAPSDDPFAAFDAFPADDPDTGAYGSVESGVFALTTDGERHIDQRGTSREGVVTAELPNGEYVFGVEVFNREAERAWRVRGGVRQGDLPFGLAGVSDVVLLNTEGDLPLSLEEALPRVLRTVRLKSGQPIVMAWEVYGLQEGESATIGITLQDGDPGLLARAGQFLRLTSPEAPVEMSWEEGGPDQRGTVFRAIGMGLPEIEPGEYDLILSVDLAGRNPIEITRRVVIEP